MKKKIDFEGDEDTLEGCVEDAYVKHWINAGTHLLISCVLFVPDEKRAILLAIF